MRVSANEVVLSLPFEALASIPEGINEVRKYRDKYLDCDVVGKRIDISWLDQSTLPEASTLKSIDHPNVVKIRSAAEVKNYVSDPLMKIVEIVTDFFERGSITDAQLRGEQFSGPEAVAIVRSTLRGLRELHVRHRICHRDIKGGNILLTDPPVYAVVADLGVAGKFDSNGEVSTVNNPTLYSPPEFFSRGVLTASSDLYSLGLVFRELLGGPFPYKDYSREAVIEALKQGQEPVTEEDRELPIWAPTPVRKLYAKATHINPSKRYQTAKDMDKDLAKVKIAYWKEISDRCWEARREKGRNMCVRVEASDVKDGYLLSIKSNRSGKFRRYPNLPDEAVSTLTSAATRRVFDAANAFALN